MDVESNNIANVNTIGYKYSRANFSDLLAQTGQIATAPQGDLGGKNAVQVGLGTSVNSITKIMTQGSIQNTDKNTDVAIQGDGFFIVSSDGGNTYKYTRSGDFKFDAKGNFVDNNGFIAQGWTRNKVTGKVDATAPIANINIPPGLTTPANASTEIVLKANLSSDSTVEQFSPTHPLDSNTASAEKTEDVGVLFNSAGKAFNLKNNDTLTINVGASPSTNHTFTYTGTAGSGNFKNTEDLRRELQNALTGTEVTVDTEGKFVIKNTSGANISINSAIGSSEKFTETFQTLIGTINPTQEKRTLSMNAATHSSSIDIYDSLGSKHTAKIDFRKLQSLPASKWSFSIEVEVPATIGGLASAGFTNIMPGAGTIDFDSNGGLLGYNPPLFEIYPNNGSKQPQPVKLEFGTPNGGFDGITSFSNPSATSGISQDGFPGGDLVGIRIDQSGTLVGSFTNGRSFGLAQIGMAKFTNNEGLVSDGGNVYLQSANSGDPIIGTAATAGRGFMQSSALEASNVDLSKSLTNLIIIQRGYQANAKTITTSDTLLETLLGIKR
jgi:flagellar hook protein FlgE